MRLPSSLHEVASTAVPTRVPAGTGPHVSALLPRAVLVLAAAGGVAAQVVGRGWPGGSALPALVPVLVAVVLAWRPALPLGSVVVGGLVLLAVLSGGGLDARDALSLVAVHVVHVAGSLAAVLPPRSRVEVAALRPTWQRFLLVQAVSQVVLVVGVLAGG